MAVQVKQLITEHLDLWTQAQTAKSTSGRGSNNKIELTGIKKLRELILELAFSGKLVSHFQTDWNSQEVLKRIAKEKVEFHNKRNVRIQPFKKIADSFYLPVLPSHWREVYFDEVITYITDFQANGSFASLKDNVRYYDEKNYSLLVRLTDLRNGFSDHGSLKYTDQKGHEYLAKSEIEGSELVVANVGAGVGTTLEVPKINMPATLAPNMFMVVVSEEVSKSYFLYFSMSPVYKRYIQIVNTGTGQPKINKTEYKNCKFPLPPRAEQEAIVSKIQELMALCDQLEQQSYQQLDAHNQLVDALLATLTQSQNADELASNWQRLAAHFDTLFTTEYSIDALKQTILQLAVMGKLVKQDPNDEPASELLKRIAAEKDALVKAGKIKKQKPLPPNSEDEKPFELPKGWAREALGNLISISSGDGLTSAQMSPEGTIPVFGGNGINGFHDKGNVDEPTLVIGRVGYYCGSIHITPNKAWITDNAFITTFDTRLFDINYLALLLKGTNLKENENATAQPVISGRKLYPIRVSFPPLREQIKILHKFNELSILCDFFKEKIYESNITQSVLAEALVEQVVA